MNRIRLFAITLMLMLAAGATAQQPNTNAAAAGQPAANSHMVVPTADGQLKILAPRLELTSEQQEQIRPILQRLHGAIVKLVRDGGLSKEELGARLHDLYNKADVSIRTVLTDDQKKKLDAVEHEPHPELHVHFADAQ